jgi:hypothetical protein
MLNGWMDILALFGWKSSSKEERERHPLFSSMHTLDSFPTPTHCVSRVTERGREGIWHTHFLKASLFRLLHPSIPYAISFIYWNSTLLVATFQLSIYEGYFSGENIFWRKFRAKLKMSNKPNLGYNLANKPRPISLSLCLEPNVLSL